MIIKENKFKDELNLDQIYIEKIVVKMFFCLIDDFEREVNMVVIGFCYL